MLQVKKHRVLHDSGGRTNTDVGGVKVQSLTNPVLRLVLQVHRVLDDRGGTTRAIVRSVKIKSLTPYSFCCRFIEYFTTEATGLILIRVALESTYSVPLLLQVYRILHDSGHRTDFDLRCFEIQALTPYSFSRRFIEYFTTVAAGLTLTCCVPLKKNPASN